jgi:hypothetical protein
LFSFPSNVLSSLIIASMDKIPSSTRLLGAEGCVKSDGINLDREVGPIHPLADGCMSFAAEICLEPGRIGAGADTTARGTACTQSISSSLSQSFSLNGFPYCAPFLGPGPSF